MCLPFPPVAKTVELVKAKGGKVTREAGPVKGGSTLIAFIEDPDGYKFELLGRGPTPEPLCQVMLRVDDLDRAINYHENVRLFPTDLQAFGMELLRKRDNPEYKYTIAMMGYGPEDCRLLISGKVYDVTEFRDDHLGDDQVLLTAAGIESISQSDAGTPLIWVAGHGQPPAY
ncbi:hypothetical protein C5167_014061 [Papaver somniferum]|uniref:VOC domain-containing protein n=1 Tax=Papaver somniferum TaxID=3469 RepID=A0A4Y7J428_PAPSO|nr:hypothetical protein C5167_014061 [Papaver somniferum]